MVLGHRERHRVGGVVPADARRHGTGLEDVVLERLGEDARLVLDLGGTRHVGVGELDPTEVIDADIGVVTRAVGHGHHATALVVNRSAVPALRHGVALSLCTHGEAELVGFKRVRATGGVVDVLVTTEELTVCEAPTCGFDCILVHEGRGRVALACLCGGMQVALAVIGHRHRDGAGVTVVAHTVGAVSGQFLTVVAGLGHVEGVGARLREGERAVEEEAGSVAILAHRRRRVGGIELSRVTVLVGLEGHRIPATAIGHGTLLKLEAEGLTRDAVAALDGLGAREVGRAGQSCRACFVLVGELSRLTTIVVAHLGVKLTVEVVVGHLDGHDRLVLVVGPAGTRLGVALIEVGCVNLGDLELVLALRLETDATKVCSLGLVLLHTVRDGDRIAETIINSLNVVPLRIVLINKVNLELEVSRGVSAGHTLLNRDLLVSIVASDNHRTRLVAVGDLDRAAGYAVDIELAIVLALVVDIGYHDGHLLSVGVVSPAGVRIRRILLHRKGVGALLAERQLTEIQRLGLSSIDGAGGAHMKLMLVIQTSDIADVVTRSRQREAIAHAVGRRRTGHRLGHLNLMVRAIAGLSRGRVVLVNETKSRNRIVACVRVCLVDNDFVAHISAACILDLGHGGQRVHGAVAVIHNLNVHAVLSLVAGYSGQRISVVRCGLVHDVAVGLACIGLVEAYVLELSHGNARISSSSRVLEALVCIGQLGVCLVGRHTAGIRARNGERELVVCHRTTIELLGHYDTAFALSAIVHGRLIGVGEQSLVRSVVMLVVAVGNGCEQLAVIGRILAVVTVGHGHRHGGDVGVIRHAVEDATGSLGALLVSDLVHGEHVGAHLGERQVAELEVGRTVLHVVLADRHCLGLVEHGHEAAAVCCRAARLGQTEEERLAVLHLAAVEGLGSLDRGHAVLAERHVGRFVGVGKHEVFGSNVRRRNDVRSISVADLSHRHLDDVLGLVVRHTRLGLTSLVLGELGHLVLIGATKITAVKGNGAEGEIVSRVVYGLGVARLIGPCGQRDLVYAIGIRAGLRIVGVIAAKCLNLEGELVGVDGVAAHFVGIVLGAVNVGGATVSVILVDEGHRVTLNRNDRVILHAVVVGALFDGNVGNLQVARTVVRHRNNHAVESARIVDARNGVGVVVLSDAVAVLARHRERDVAEGSRVIRSLAVHRDGGVSGFRRSNTSSSCVAQTVNLKREFVGVAPITALQILLHLDGVSAQAHIRRMVRVAERERCLRAGRNRADHNTVRSVGVLDILLARGIRHRPAVLANALLGHGKRRASGEPVDADRGAAGDGQLRRAIGERHLTGSGIGSANVVVILAGKKLGCPVLTSRSSGIGDVKREGVLVLLRLIGGVAPIDVLLDLERTGHLKRQLAVVAERLGHVAALSPRRVQDVSSRAGLIGFLDIRQGVRTLCALGVCRDVVRTLRRPLNSVPLGSTDRHGAVAVGHLARRGAVSGLDPVRVLVVQRGRVSDGIPVRLSRAPRIGVERRVLRVVIELVARIGREGRRSGTVGSVLDEAVGVEVDGSTVVGRLGRNDGGVHVARRITQRGLRLCLEAHAVEQADGICLRHGHGASVGVHVIVTHGQKRCRERHSHFVTRSEISAVLDGHHQIGKVGRAIDLVAINLPLEVVGVGIALGGLTRAGVDLVAVRELNLILAGTRARHLHVIAEPILERKRTGLGVALLGVLFNRRTGTDTLLDLIGNLVKDLFD